MGLIEKLFGKKTKMTQEQYVRMFNNQIPVFSSFGRDIYASDLVRASIRSIATEISKSEIKSIVYNKLTNMITNGKEDLNRLFYCNPNPIMTVADFLERIVWLRELNMNVFIYPTFKEQPSSRGKKKRIYTGLYLLSPNLVEFYENENKFYVQFSFDNEAKSPMIPYGDIIHIRKDYSMNEMFGGNVTGGAEKKEILKILEANTKAVDGIGNAIETSMKLKGIISAKTLLDEAKLSKEREKFESQLNETESGLVATDLSIEVTPFKIDPTIVNKDTMDFIEQKIFRNYGVSTAIVNGTANESERNLFYQQTLQPFINKIKQAFTKVLYTQEEKDNGHQIGVFLNVLMNADLNTKIKFADIGSNMGLSTINEMRNLFGYPPVEGGEERIQSLNYINSGIASDYQLGKIKDKQSKEELENNEGKK